MGLALMHDENLSAIIINKSYWDMTRKGRVDKKLLANLAKEIFDAMEKHLGQNQTIHSRDKSIGMPMS